MKQMIGIVGGIGRYAGTEISLAIQTEVIENSLVIDATKILAQALIRESSN